MKIEKSTPSGFEALEVKDFCALESSSPSEITSSTPKSEILKISTICKKCGHCCKHGVGFASEKEIEKIAKHLEISVEELKEKKFEKTLIFNKEIYKPKQIKKDLPFGPCIFLKDEVCIIHDVKPIHCKVGNCNEHGEELTEWYYVNHLVDFDDPQSIREWQTRIELKPTIKGGSPIENLDKDKLEKIKKYVILRKFEMNDTDGGKKNGKNNRN